MLLGQDYVSGLFVEDALGNIPGTLPLSAINFKGSAVTSGSGHRHQFPIFCRRLRRAVDVRRDGCRSHATARARHAWKFQPRRYEKFHGCHRPGLPGQVYRSGTGEQRQRRDDACTSLGLKLSKKGDLIGRVLTESLKAGNRQPPQVKQLTRISEPAKSGLQTVLLVQVVGNSMYFDAAGFPGRTVGLERLPLATAKPLQPERTERRWRNRLFFDQGQRIARVERLGDQRQIIWQAVPSGSPTYGVLASKKVKAAAFVTALPCESAL